jgi:hypothetical protein
MTNDLADILAVADDDRLWRWWYSRLVTESRVLRFDADVRTALGTAYFGEPGMSVGEDWEQGWTGENAVKADDRRRIVAWTWMRGVRAPGDEQRLERALESVDFSPCAVYQRVAAVTSDLKDQFGAVMSDWRISDYDLALWLEDHGKHEWPVSVETLLRLCREAGVVVARADPPSSAQLWALTPEAARWREEHSASSPRLEESLKEIASAMPLLAEAFSRLFMVDAAAEAFHAAIPEPPKADTKYRPWFDYLDGIDGSMEMVTLPVAEMAAMLGDRKPRRGRGAAGLPNSAISKPGSWWINTQRVTANGKRDRPSSEWSSSSNSAQSSAWLAAGFKVYVNGDCDELTLRFEAMPGRARWYADRQSLRTGYDASGRQLISQSLIRGHRG